MKSQLTFKRIPDDKADMWRATVLDLDDQGRLRNMEISSQYGTLYFGEGSDGRIGWAWKEQGGGGSVTVIYSLQPGQPLLEGLWIGLLIEDRKNMNGKYPCITGGFVKPDETHQEANCREFADETGGQVEKNKPLVGLPINSNRLYFITDPDKGTGVFAFAVEVPFGDLIPAADGTRSHNSWKPKNRTLSFMPWRMMARHTPDALAGLPMLRLLALLTEPRLNGKS